MSSDLESRRADVAYLSIFKKLIEVNIKLQGTNVCLIKTKGIITMTSQRAATIPINAFYTIKSFWKSEYSFNNFSLYAYLKETQCMLFNSDSRLSHSFEPL